MSTTLFSFGRHHMSWGADDPFLDVQSSEYAHAATSAPVGSRSLLSNLTWGLFVLEVVIACLAIGQLVVWTATAASPDTPKLVVSACDAAFGMGIILKRIPLLLI